MHLKKFLSYSFLSSILLFLPHFCLYTLGPNSFTLLLLLIAHARIDRRSKGKVKCRQRREIKYVCRGVMKLIKTPWTNGLTRSCDIHFRHGQPKPASQTRPLQTASNRLRPPQTASNRLSAWAYYIASSYVGQWHFIACWPVVFTRWNSPALFDQKAKWIGYCNGL